MLIVLNLLWRLVPVVRMRKGTVSALFVILYACFRITLENFRQPDAQLGFLFWFCHHGAASFAAVAVVRFLFVISSL